jgi:hypothetical protein
VAHWAKTSGWQALLIAVLPAAFCRSDPFHTLPLPIPTARVCVGFGIPILHWAVTLYFLTAYEYCCFYTVQ